MQSLTPAQSSTLKEILDRKGFQTLGKGGKVITKYNGSYKGLPSFVKAEVVDREIAATKGLAEFYALLGSDSSQFYSLLLGVAQEMAQEFDEMNRPGPKFDQAEVGEGSFHKTYRDYFPIIFENRSLTDCVGLVHRPTMSMVEAGSDISPDIWMTAMGLSVEELLTNDQVQKVCVTFNPLRPERTYVAANSRGVVSQYYNLYQEPVWRKLNATPKFHGFIKTLFEHLFPNLEEREYVLDWFHHAMTTRCATVLCLVGARGTGKTLLLENIASPLFGEAMFARGNQSLLEEKFNPQFENRRFVYLDEVDIEQDQSIAKIKAYSNDLISIEKKGQDAFTTANYVSLGLSTNVRDKFRIQPQERRFSVPEVTEHNLATKIPAHEIAAFIERIKNPESLEIAEFGEWLRARRPKYNNQEPLKGEYFFRLCDATMAAWKDFLVRYLGSSQEIDQQYRFKELSAAFSKETSSGPAHLNGGGVTRIPTRRSVVEEFLTDYRYRGRYKIGSTYEYEDADGKVRWGVAANPDFVEAYQAMKAEKKAEDIL